MKTINGGFERTAQLLLEALREMRALQRRALAEADWSAAGSATDCAKRIEELLSSDSGECGLIALIEKRDPSAAGILASQLDRAKGMTADELERARRGVK